MVRLIWLHFFFFFIPHKFIIIPEYQIAVIGFVVKKNIWRIITMLNRFWAIKKNKKINILRCVFFVEKINQTNILSHLQISIDKPSTGLLENLFDIKAIYFVGYAEIYTCVFIVNFFFFIIIIFDKIEILLDYFPCNWLKWK